MDVQELAREYGWAISIFPEEGQAHKYVLAKVRNTISDQSITVHSCLLLLGILRENYPNADVRDKCAELIVALKGYARTTEE